MAKKKTWLEKLGLEPVRKLNKTICKERVAHLKRGVKNEEYKGKLLEKANYYINWYGWMADNGGTRAEAA